MHEHYLKAALALADSRRGFCAPNPTVGAVVVKDNVILATGCHWASGCPHAEVEALKKIANQAQGATIYVTLEPCCHFGKTPPCTDLLIRSGIKQVIYGMRDLNPQVANKSAALLNNAGIETIYLPLPEISDFYHSYVFWWQTKRPFVTAKIALSLDGKIAGINGQRINITGASAKQFTQQQRQRSDAILTTAKTIIGDDPLLNVRLADATISKPIYIIDSQLNTPLNAKIWTAAQKITVFHSSNQAEKIKSLSAKGAHCIPISGQQNGLNLAEILQWIGKEGMHDLWVEAGGRCFAAFVQQKLLQRAYIYVAPKWLGATAQTAFSEKILFEDAKKISWKNLAEDALCEMTW